MEVVTTAGYYAPHEYHSDHYDPHYRHSTRERLVPQAPAQNPWSISCRRIREVTEQPCTERVRSRTQQTDYRQLPLDYAGAKRTAELSSDTTSAPLIYPRLLRLYVDFP